MLSSIINDSKSSNILMIRTMIIVEIKHEIEDYNEKDNKIKWRWTDCNNKRGSI